jgi:hypothetical protein
VALMGAQKTRMQIGLCNVKTVLIRFQMGARTLVEFGLEAKHATFWQRNCLHFVHALRI